MTTPEVDAERKILPCPFCGNRARLDRVDDKPLFWVECVQSTDSGCGASGVIKDTAAQAVAAWNHRSLPANHVPDAGKMMPDARFVLPMSAVIERLEFASRMSTDGAIARETYAVAAKMLAATPAGSEGAMT